ncbi:MAG: RimK/LysX family protein [Candidatus Saccharimonadales bacterium]
MNKTLDGIGRNALVEFIRHANAVPAKVDTGADSSAVWATNIYMDTDHRLHFVLFGQESPFYTGQEVVTDEYSVSRVRSSSGHSQIRYRVPLSVRVAGRRVRATFTLADRSKNIFPVLIGRRTLAGRFVVDVSRSECDESATGKTRRLNTELRKDPYAFYKKYHHNGTNDDKVKK